MKKVLMIIGGIVVGIVAFGIVLFAIVSLTSKKMVCKSKEGNITIMYNNKTLTGYTAKNISYDLSGQKQYAKKVGVDTYLTEFSEWFKTHTSGSCSR